MAAKDETKSSDEKKLVQSCEMMLIMAILKLYTGSSKAMSITEIACKLNDFFKDYSERDSDLFAERTLYRKVDLLASFAQNDAGINKSIDQMLLILTGGRISFRSADGIVSGANRSGKGSQRRYFFQPLLTNSDLDMICASLMSSRYLSDDEKNYLIARLDILKSEYDENDREQIEKSLFARLPEKRSQSARATVGRNLLPYENSVMLTHIRTIYEAILNETQIEVTYGMYDIRERSSRVDFHPRNEDKPYILNPYAMIWNDGEYYLIATHYNYKNPVHFRIDRIIDVKSHHYEKKDKGGKPVRVPAKRNKIPPTLEPFFHKYKKLRVFDSIAYTNRYPSMKIYGKEDLVDCCFECTSISLQILIDYFGPGLRLGETPVSHPANDLDINGNPKHYITATVSGIQRENLVDFAVEHANTITLLSPAELVDEVRGKLKEIYERYSSIQ